MTQVEVGTLDFRVSGVFAAPRRCESTTSLSFRSYPLPVVSVAMPNEVLTQVTCRQVSSKYHRFRRAGRIVPHSVCTA